MKHFKLFFVITVFGILIAACGSKAKTDEAPAQEPPATEATADKAPHGTSAEFTSDYVCPMHCEGSGSDQPGKCPKCGMDYVAQAVHTDDGHTH